MQIAKLRDLLQTGDERGEWIVTVPRVGYRLLRQDKVAATESAPAPSVKPSIAVLPLTIWVVPTVRTSAPMAS